MYNPKKMPHRSPIIDPAWELYRLLWLILRFHPDYKHSFIGHNVNHKFLQLYTDYI